MEMNLFREVSNYLNLTWKLVDLPNPGGWGKRLSNGTMVGGIFQPLQEGDADVAFCNIWQRDTTFDIIDFGPPLNKIYVTFIVRRPYQLSERWQSLIGIFENDVWLFTCITFVIASLVFWTGHSLASYTEIRPSLIESALIMFGMLMMSTSYQHASTFHLRLVVTCWLVFTLLFTTALTSSIVTRLTVPLYSPRVDSVQQLVERDYYWTQPVYLHCRATLSQFYFNLDNTWHHQLESRYKHIKLEDIDEYLNSDESIAIVAQRWGDWVMFEMEGFDETRDLAEFRLMRGSIREAYTSFAFRKHFSFNQLFTRTIQLFIDHGLWAYWVRKLTQEDFNRKQLLIEKDVTEFNQPEQLTLMKLRPVFYLLVIGLSLSFIVFSIELCYRYS
ncbi:glutamate receptor ionotropic, kainate 1 [Homalodisca vitripennis]|uniref:glutamate receptor ionotropic, kainate 1 n=1 Tax=Homalodisca vitripennis TaxID=197043 RepID=UPI001EEBE9F0|nr:glutamate receptor ionotropic, kainate 1 [Homalodisca vitripennis]